MTTIENEVAAAKQRYGIVGNAPALTAALERAVRVAPIDLSVLVTGESGTGKEFFPKIIHSYSPRKHARYIAVNCGAIPEGTIDSELFGHEKGSFTGAVSTRKGYFEEANGGTIFLDEVGELPLTTQARLLRVLETGEFMKVGSSTVQKTDIRVVAATNVNMLEAVRQGKFREDLYYRLSTVQISVPPLRDRGNDILLLARKFAADFSERYRTPRITLTDAASHLLLHYGWPGNVRQLKNVIEQLALFNAGAEISPDDLAHYLPDMARTFSPVASSASGRAGAESGAYEREREMLFNMIFRLQKEIDSLREQISSRPAPVTDVLDDSVITPHEEVCYPTSIVRFNDRPIIDFSKIPATDSNPAPEEHTPSRPAAVPDTAQTLEETERETIRRALERNMGRRKETANELNISERTLYRKIKDYNLE